MKKKPTFIPYPKTEKELEAHMREKHLLPSIKNKSTNWLLGSSSWENDHRQAHACREEGLWRKRNHRHYK